MATNLMPGEQRQATARAMTHQDATRPDQDRQRAQDNRNVTAVGRRHAGWRASLAGLFAVGIFSGTGLSHGRITSDATLLTDQALAGTWDLASIAGNLVGPHMRSAVLSQRVTFQNGIVTGVTRLRPGTEAATTAMPFPDASVTQIYTNTTSREVIVTWDGTYRLLSNGRIEVKMGTRRFKIGARYNYVTRALEMDQDAILTYGGGSHYHAAN